MEPLSEGREWGTTRVAGGAEMRLSQFNSEAWWKDLIMKTRQNGSMAHKGLRVSQMCLYIYINILAAMCSFVLMCPPTYNTDVLQQISLLIFLKMEQGRWQAAVVGGGWWWVGGNLSSFFNHHHSRLTVPVGPYTLGQTAKAESPSASRIPQQWAVIGINGPWLCSHF